MEDVDLHRAAIIRSHCTKEVTINAVHPKVLAAMAAAAAAFPDWKLKVQQAPEEQGGEVAGFLEKSNQTKLVGFWSQTGNSVTPDYETLSELVLKYARKHADNPTQVDYSGYAFWVYWMLPLLFWRLLFYSVPPIWEGYLEFGRSYGGYWTLAALAIYVCSVYLWSHLLCTLRFYIQLGTRDDLYLVEDFRVRSLQSKAKGLGFFRRWLAWVLSGIPWPFRR